MKHQPNDVFRNTPRPYESDAELTRVVAERDALRVEAERLTKQEALVRQTANAEIEHLKKERDEARADFNATAQLLAEKQADAARLTKERDEARAETERLVSRLENELKPALDAAALVHDQNKADAAQLRAALERVLVEDCMCYFNDEADQRECERCVQARAALAGRGPSLTPREVAERVREACAAAIPARATLSEVERSIMSIDLDALLGGGE